MYILIGLAKFIVAMVAVVSFLLLLKNAFLMLREIRPGTSWLRDLYGSSVNVIFLKKFLTEKGLDHRRKVIFHGCIVFPLAFLLVQLDQFSRTLDFP